MMLRVYIKKTNQLANVVNLEFKKHVYMDQRKDMHFNFQLELTHWKAARWNTYQSILDFEVLGRMAQINSILSKVMNTIHGYQQDVLVVMEVCCRLETLPTTEFATK